MLFDSIPHTTLSEVLGPSLATLPTSFHEWKTFNNLKPEDIERVKRKHCPRSFAIPPQSGRDSAERRGDLEKLERR